MPLYEPARASRVRADIEHQDYAVISAVALPARYFETTQGTADILLRRLDDGSGCILLIEESAHYRGDDARVMACFTHSVRSGWRPLVLLSSVDAASVLRQADLMLGLNGNAPRVPVPPQRKEISFPAPEPEPTPGRENERFGSDLVEEARRGRLAPALFREEETAAAIRILSKQGKNAVCLVGEAGVGKTAVVEQLAIGVAGGNVPPAMRDVRILDINLSFVAAGAVHQNEFEGRLKEVLEQARRDPRVVLFFDEVHTICRPGSDASQMVKSDLGRGRIRCIGATTPTEFRAIEADPALARRFQVVRVDELGQEQTIKVLDRCRARLEAHHQVSIPREMLAAAVDLSVRYAPHRRLPDKAIDLLDEASACARLTRWHAQQIEEEGSKK